ncbi:MAG TPA: MmgE/PrpD family protein [Azospirillum sp.]|nr:MmgE/PrpD family protein [Azospirillum sp.]
MDATPSLTLGFAERVLAITPDRLSADDRAQLRRLLLDYAGVTAAGTSLPWSHKLAAWTKRFAGSGKALAFAGGARMAPSIAALVNGTAAHGYELDDTHDPSMSHPGAVIVTAALAVAEEVNAPGPAFLAAVAAGYEAMACIGEAAGAPHVIEFGHHPTALFGGFGAAASAVHLLGGRAEELARAWGHVLSSASGSMQFSDEPSGTMIKRLHAGYAAQVGVQAAELSMAGLTAPLRALDGKFGFFRLYGHHVDHGPVAARADGPLRIHGISLKPYSCCRLFHSLIDGLGEVTDGYTLSPSRIRAIRVRGPKVIVDQHMLRRPASPMAAQYALPYVVGATLLFGPHRYDAFGEANLGNADLLAIGDRVEAVQDTEIERHFPRHFGTGVDLTLDDGSTRSATVLDSIGTPARPMDADIIRTKMAGLARVTGRTIAMEEIAAAVSALETGADAGHLAAAIAG